MLETRADRRRESSRLPLLRGAARQAQVRERMVLSPIGPFVIQDLLELGGRLDSLAQTKERQSAKVRHLGVGASKRHGWCEQFDRLGRVVELERNSSTY